MHYSQPERFLLPSIALQAELFSSQIIMDKGPRASHDSYLTRSTWSSTTTVHEDGWFEAVS